MNRNEAWQDLLILERELHVVNEERRRLLAEIAIRLVVVKGENAYIIPS